MVYLSGNLKICESSHHKEMWIINYPDNKFYSINTTFDIISTLHPVEKIIIE